MSYRVYRVEYQVAVPDPDMPSPRYHNVIFVETGADGSGISHQVVGDLVTGMSYQSERDEAPQTSGTFHARHYLGTINESDYPARMDEVLEELPPPGKQKSFNTQTMRTEQHKMPGVFYAPGEPRPPMIKCTEWTINQAIPALIESGVLRT
ncbi:hypothetical protein DRE_07356 [Drechslerella stenobrocha 248]|uniref:Uncharacterized protein n=1 Tax=Drechslerella stenobrocha 248 TaxID=1043628 RepID=W7HV43_9PEZI|nr:hypothetical protein DRE_07356 [Drechslerella stenobrocha 248]